MIGKLDVDKKNVDFHLARKKKLTFDVSKVQDGKKRQKRRERNEKSEQISESSGKARERKRERTMKYRNGRDRAEEAGGLREEAAKEEATL